MICAGVAGWHHRERVCAAHTITQIATFVGAAGDGLAISFDCFNNNQACGQAIAAAIQRFLQAGGALVAAADFCEPPVIGPDALAAFNCYRKVWHAMQKMIQASKFIDVAVATCPADGQREPDIEPLDPTYLNGDEFQNETLALEANAASWSAIGQQAALPQDPSDVKSAPVERRLVADRSFSTDRSDLMRRLEELKSDVARFTRFGVNVEDEEAMEDLPESVDTEELIRAFAAAFPDAQASSGVVPAAEDVHV